MQNKLLSESITASSGRREADYLDRKVDATLQGSWLEGISGFFDSAAHTFLLALAITQVSALISLALVTRRQQHLIVELLDQPKTLSRWGFGNRVVEAVLRDSAAGGASTATPGRRRALNRARGGRFFLAPRRHQFTT